MTYLPRRRSYAAACVLWVPRMPFGERPNLRPLHPDNRRGDRSLAESIPFKRTNSNDCALEDACCEVDKPIRSAPS